MDIQKVKTGEILWGIILTIIIIVLVAHQFFAPRSDLSPETQILNPYGDNYGGDYPFYPNFQELIKNPIALIFYIFSFLFFIGWVIFCIDYIKNKNPTNPFNP